ncbi:hypothetical protein [Brockia lithotrophica]|uniref:Uncharacterized protein n=1 Tax=Brockia lithotrophica TaxID=933949 RepID=A0A660L6E3_9BACL|nr:hypothetical protein [Brockia lithotrophica]RKQ88392.1 hypothetical protein C7438_0025 [Brockia lithotrophica]
MNAEKPTETELVRARARAVVEVLRASEVGQRFRAAAARCARHPRLAPLVRAWHLARSRGDTAAVERLEAEISAYPVGAEYLVLWEELAARRDLVLSVLEGALNRALGEAGSDGV